MSLRFVQFDFIQIHVIIINLSNDALNRYLSTAI